MGKRKQLVGSRSAKPSPNTKVNRANLERHAGKCKVCKHKQCNEIEEMIMAGESSYSVARGFPSLTYKNVLSHIRALRLDEKRTNIVEKKIDKIIDQWDSRQNRVVSDSLMAKCLELKGKISGELVESQEQAIDVRAELQIKVRELADRRMSNFLKRLGYKPEEETTVGATSKEREVLTRSA